MKKSNKALVIVLMTAVLLWSVPATSVMAVGIGSTGSPNLRGGLKNNASGDQTQAEAAANQVVVLYEEGEIPVSDDAAVQAADPVSDQAGGQVSGRSAGKRKAKAGSAEDTEAAESAQEKIIEEAIDGNFTIDDTIVIETADETAEDMVVSVVSSSDYSAEDLADTLQKADGIKYAEPNYKYTISSIPDWNDTFIKDEWYLGENGINVNKAPETAGTDPVVLAVMDTGIDYTHPDLEDRMWTAPEGFSLKGEHGVDWSDRDDDPMDENGHGTHCAGIIAAAANNSKGVAGVAGTVPNVQLMGVRVLDPDGSGYLEDIVRAFKYLIRAKNEGVNIKAVNCSFGAEATSDIFDEVIEQAGQAGILTIAAAGNETQNNDSTNVSPANSKSDYVVVVAATDEDGSLASYSNFGQKNVDIGAPGSNIISSVSYYNFAPYLYDAESVKATTQVYGEFGDAPIATDAETGEDTVLPVLGTAYDGSEITDVATFGASKMYADKSKESQGKMSLEITDENGFGVGNNDKSLRWKITDADPGDKYILYFPYEKLKGNPVINIVFRSHTGYEETDGTGLLLVGDVKIDDIDSQGNLTYSTTAEDTMTGIGVDPTWNSIWQASGIYDDLYDRSDVKDLAADRYGLGFVYESFSGGDIYVDISSIAISLADVDEVKFGAYDVYSGTSMATPAVTGAAGLIAAADPSIDAETLKATLLGTTRASSSLNGQCSTGGRIDFAEYSGQAETAKPSISSAAADYGNATVTLKGRGFGDAPVVKAFRNAAAEGEDAEIAIDRADIKADGGNTITISKAGYNDYDLIGSDIRFEITNGDRTGEGSFYVVKGLKAYNEEFNTALESEEEFEMWQKTAKNRQDGEALASDAYDDGGDEEEEDPVMPAGLSYLTGANGLYKYDTEGGIYKLEKKNGKYYAKYIGISPNEAIRAYSDEISKKVEYWAPDLDQDRDSMYFMQVGNPVYLGDVIYELGFVDMVDRDAYVLMGLDLNDVDPSWEIYYDSLAGFGTKPEELDFRKLESVTLAAYGGKIYMIGGNSEEKYDEATDEYTVEICKDFFSCVPDTKGSTWKYEGEMPEARTNGKAISSNGKLFYMFSNDADGYIDYSIYAYDGKTWEKVGELPKALSADAAGATISVVGDVIYLYFDFSDKILCATGIDEKGIIFAGKSFDGPGDTFRFNTKTNKVEPLEYSLWETISDRPVDGTAVGSKLFAEYTKESTYEVIGKSFPIKTGYVKLDKIVSGKGSGMVSGGGYYAKGDKTEVRIRADKGSYIYSIHTSGMAKDMNKDFGKQTADGKKTYTLTFDAQKDADIDVEFGRISTKVIMPSAKITKMVGKRKINAHTDGTTSGVTWKSGNTKYATVNKDGTITFKKAGVGKTVKLTATSIEDPKLKASCEVKIVSRQLKKFTWNGKKLTSKTKVLVDSPLSKAKTPKSFKVTRSGAKATLKWKKVSKVSGYIVFRKTGNGRFVQVAKLGAGKTSYTDKKAKKGNKYLVVSYTKSGKAIRISPATAAK